ncbi:MAG: HD domain-containing protein [Bacteroidales bacterium]|nr:HD domain-containing protein [Bacteroidales bacterium]
MRRKFFVIVFFVLAFVTAFAQSDEYGIPQIKNFGPADYRQESQNFCVVQDKNSLMYFGNTNGVMEYDGEHWTIVKVPGRPKIAVNENNDIFYGGYNTFGKVVYKDGHLSLEEYSNNLDCTFGQIVKVVTCSDAVYFASSDKLFMYANSTVKKIIDNKPFRLIELNGSAYVQKRFSPLQRLNHGKLETDELCTAVDSIDVADLIMAKDDHIIVRDGQRTCFFSYSKANGLKYFHTEFNRYINKNEYSKMAVLRDGTFVVGTKLGGIVAFDEEGKARFMANTSNGLKDNSINDLYIDNQNKIWIATENGISLLETNSGLSIFNASSGLRGAVLSVIRFNETLYVGTTVGLFKHYRLETPGGVMYGFRSIRGVYENCWQLCIYDNHLYAVTSGGLFDIEEGNAEKVMDGSLISMMPITIGEDEYVLLGGHSGIIFTTISEGKIEKIGNLKNMTHTVRTIATDTDGNVWLGTDRDGLYRFSIGDSLNLDAMVSSYGASDGLPPDFDWVDVYSTTRLGPVFSTSLGLYRYDKKQEKFAKDTTCFCIGTDCSSVFGIIREDSNGNIWYNCSLADAYERECGIIRFDYDGSYVRETSAFGQMRESVVETIFPENADVVWFGTSDALIKYHRNKNLQITNDSAFVCMIRTVAVANDSIIYAFDHDYQEDAALVHEIKYLDRKIRFEVSGLAYNTFGNTEYQFMLEGLDDGWSEWTTDSYKEYISLSEGKYKFMVRSRNGYGQLSNIAEFNFEVTPPYYRSTLAYILYFLCFIVITMLIVAWRNIVHTREKYRLEKLVERRTNDLVLQKEQTERLVKKLLPQNTVTELQQTGNATSKKYDMVTVLFSDIQGFTKIAASTNPEELIKYLNELFVSFDNIISKYNIEKIKTIGDAYMCAGGMPNRDATNPVEVVLAGMEMQRALDELNKKHDLKMKMRVGIHTGPVVAGVVGAQKIEYDIWGDTVNIASRMESHGEVGKVNISEETYRHVKEFFKCEPRGRMDVKNKGEMEMYFVNGILEELSENGDSKTPNHLFNVRKLGLNFFIIQEEILNQMQRDLPKNLYYHNIKHTTDAIYRVTDIGTKENVSEEDLLLLRCAALFHDSGFLISYDSNEEYGADIARQHLGPYKFSREQIDKIRGIIIATKVPQNPHNLLEEIMCDADLDYLGRPDFIPISQNLFRELFERGRIDSIEQWNKMQYKFITEHHYFTETAKRSGEPGKQQVLRELKELI